MFGIDDALMGSIIGTVGNLIGSGGGAALNMKLQNDAQDFEHREAMIGRDWQLARMKEAMTYNSAEAAKVRGFNSLEAARQKTYEMKMSNSAYRRAVADMSAAGLNPMLAMMKGGASTPSVSAPSAGSSASISGGGGAPTGHARMASMPDISHIGSSAVQMLDTMATIANKVKEGNLIDAQARNFDAQASLTTHSAGQLDASRDKLREEIAEVQARVRNLDQMTQTEMKRQDVLVTEEQLNRARRYLTDAQRFSESKRPDLLLAETRLRKAEAVLRGQDVEIGEEKVRAVHTLGRSGDTWDAILKNTARGFFNMFGPDYNPNYDGAMP